MATQKTLENLLGFITQIDKRLGAEPNKDLYIVMMNEAVGIISEAVGPFETSWDNAAAGELTLTGNASTLPIDCIYPETAEWDGDDNRLTKTTTAWLDTNEPGWRSATGDPDKWVCTGHEILLNSIPSSATGKLVLRGRGMLPEFTEDGVTNPLIYLPRQFQMLPAYFVLGDLPTVHVAAVSETVEAQRFAAEENRRRYEKRAKYAQMWTAGLIALTSSMNVRKGLPFGY